jgi:hypothetical protein
MDLSLAKYVAARTTFAGCPKCEGEYPARIQFYDGLEAIMKELREVLVQHNYIDWVKLDESYPDIKIEFMHGRHCIEIVVVSFGEKQDKLINGPIKLFKNKDIRNAKDDLISIEDLFVELSWIIGV